MAATPVLCRSPALPELFRRGQAALPVLRPLFQQFVRELAPNENLLHIWHKAILPHYARLPESQSSLLGHALASFCAELLEQVARQTLEQPTAKCSVYSLLRAARQSARDQDSDSVCRVPGTWKGELACCMALLARVPAAQAHPPDLGKYVAEHETGHETSDLHVATKSQQPVPFIQSALTAMAYGYLHMLASALAAGHPEPDPQQPDTWLHAALYSGAAAILYEHLLSPSQQDSLKQGGQQKEKQLQKQDLCSCKDSLLDQLRISLHHAQPFPVRPLS